MSAVQSIEGAAPQKRFGSKARAALLGSALALTAVLGIRYVRGAGRETTDDAQVEGHLVNVYSRVLGRVAKVKVHDNQLVEIGDVLVELEDEEATAKLELAKAEQQLAASNLQASQAQLSLTERTLDANRSQARGGMTQASQSLASGQAAIDEAQAEIDNADARLKLAQTEFDRVKNLADTGAVPSAELESKKALLDQALSARTRALSKKTSLKFAAEALAGSMTSAQGRLVVAEAVSEQLQIARANVGAAEARARQSEVNVKLAQLNLEYCRIRSTVRGVVSRRTVEPGHVVDPSRTLLALVPPDDVWIVANFKEDQVARMRAGSPARITVDAFRGTAFSAHVESLSAASGARFALLPPDNASGNFTKVVQRIPVKLVIDDPQGLTLRPGMSADVTVDTR